MLFGLLLMGLEPLGLVLLGFGVLGGGGGRAEVGEGGVGACEGVVGAEGEEVVDFNVHLLIR